MKSARGITLERSQLQSHGLQYDREWMITDENYHFQTQRQCHELAQLSTHIDWENKRLILKHGKGESFEVGLEEEGRPCQCKIWNDECAGWDLGDAVSKWFSHTLVQCSPKYRLVRINPQIPRAVEPTYLGGVSSSTYFTDGYPLLITTENSLSHLNDRLLEKGREPVVMERFRPNLVIAGTATKETVGHGPIFEENHWRELGKIEESKDGGERICYQFGLRKPCKRCVITTLDPHTGAVLDPQEPLATLQTLSPFSSTKFASTNFERGAYFGQNAIVVEGQGAMVSVGDELKVIS